MIKKLLCFILSIIIIMPFLPLSTISEAGIVNEKIGNIFSDIPEKSWYTDECLWCNSNGYITGTSETTFSPNDNLTRAMFVQILAKFDGVDLSKVRYSGRFSDVTKDNWYAEAVQWAVDSGIANGTSDTTFSPKNEVSREQLAVFFYSYVKYKKYEVTVSAELSEYSDRYSISSWAVRSVRWAVGVGLISGTTATLLSPKSKTTRAQAAVIFKYFYDNKDKIMNKPADNTENTKYKPRKSENGMDYYDILNAPFKIYGVYKEGSEFVRIPKNVASTVSTGVEYLNYNTAGGRVKFKTNSKRIAVSVKLNHIGKLAHFAFTGSIGLDFYVRRDGDNIYAGTFKPSVDTEDGFDAVIYFENNDLNEITINLPSYSGITQLLVGVEKDFVIAPADDYKIDKPVVFYGSSITQGGCASRPGMTYENILSRAFDFDYINLGFANNAKAEDEIIDYINTLDMSVFVLDYDHNAPSSEYLEKTHEKMFLKIRNANPDLPIIIMSRPKYYLTEDEERNLEIIRQTYTNAVKRGDKNVYFLDGKELMALAKDNGTVDNCHPTDFGFASMASALEPVFEEIFK